jgi:phosphoribosyl-ATP pyrophosphohydrolase/phosphoribosyl-AMP cyclohydrolase
MGITETKSVIGKKTSVKAKQIPLPSEETAQATAKPHDLEFLLELEQILRTRKKEMPKGSYSTRLFKKGIDKIAQKLGEEAVETIIAAKNKRNEETIYESADLVYHLLVLLVEKDLSLKDIVQEMKIRSKK